MKNKIKKIELKKALDDSKVVLDGRPSYSRYFIKNGDKAYTVKDKEAFDRVKKRLTPNKLNLLNDNEGIIEEAAKKFSKRVQDKMNLSPMLKVYFDTEFTGLQKDTSLISLGIKTERGDTFYAEFTDYDKEKVANDKWLQDNVLANLKLLGKVEAPYCNRTVLLGNDYNPMGNVEVLGDSAFIKDMLQQWLCGICMQLCQKLEFWSDCLSYDWVLFTDIFGSAWDLPFYIYPYPMDICTLFRDRGVDPDINREDFAEFRGKAEKHNALFDAEIIKMCYDKLMSKTYGYGLHKFFTE